MIYLTSGITQSVWLSLRETAGATTSFTFNLTHDMSGATVSFTPIDKQPTNPWSRFELLVGPTQSLPDVLNLRAGMWSFTVTSGGSEIETGKILVEQDTNWTVIERADKNIKVLKR